MIYLLLISLMALFVFCYQFSGKDFFSPASVQILTFAGTVFMCIYFMLAMDAKHDFHWETIGIILSCMSLTAVIGIAIHHFFKRIKVKSHTPKTVRISPISNGASVIIIAVILFTIGWLLSEIILMGGTSGSFAEIMSRFHALNSYSTEESGRLPSALSQLLQLLQILLLIYGFNLLRFFRTLTIGQKILNIIVLGLCFLSSLLTGGRSGSINAIISIFIFFHLLRIQRNGKYKKYRLKFLLRIAIIVVLVMSAFFLLKGFVGRTGGSTELDPVSYLAYYTGSQYITLDEYFQNPPPNSNIFGKETFYGHIQFLIRHKLLDIPPYIIHLEFRPVGAGYSSNVYTFIRSYHYDFGLAGMYFLHILSILLLSLFYEYVKKRRGNLGILIFGQMYYTIVMSFFAERFYSNIFNVGFLKQMLMLVILYELLIRKRIHFELRKGQLKH